MPAICSREVDWTGLQAAMDHALHEHRTLAVVSAFGDWQKGINAIARAFHPGGGLPAMAINCGGPSFNLSPDYLLQEVRPRLVDMVTRIETALQRRARAGDGAAARAEAGTPLKG